MSVTSNEAMLSPRTVSMEYGWEPDHHGLKAN